MPQTVFFLVELRTPHLKVSVKLRAHRGLSLRRKFIERGQGDTTCSHQTPSGGCYLVHHIERNRVVFNQRWPPSAKQHSWATGESLSESPASILSCTYPAPPGAPAATKRHNHREVPLLGSAQRRARDLVQVAAMPSSAEQSTPLLPEASYELVHVGPKPGELPTGRPAR